MEEEHSDYTQDHVSSSTAPTASTSAGQGADFKVHTLQQLLDRLPSRISYSSIGITLRNSADGTEYQHRMLRRDLFDARFQMLLSDEDEDNDDEDQHQDQEHTASYDAQIDQNSDLIPGVYEGGLKTWECALDLVDVLNTMPLAQDGTASHDINVLELGCGTALPTLFLLEKTLEKSDRRSKVTLHLADYNAQVLSLVTLPNLVLAWWNSPASASYRDGSGAQISAQEREELRRRGQDHFDTQALATDATGSQQGSLTGELSLTSELLAAFMQCLDEHGVELRFYSGGWSDFPASLTPTGSSMDIVLTSETIYSLSSLPPLVDLLHRYADSSSTKKSVCLVAAKVIYFGVGGGVESFKQHAAVKSARISTVKSVTQGVGRTVLAVEF